MTAAGAAAPQLCAHCRMEIPLNEAAGINGRPFHVETCFAAGLRALTFSPGELEVLLAPTMDPMVAYRAGKTFVATVVAERRKAKGRRAPGQQAFSVASFSRKRR